MQSDAETEDTDDAVHGFVLPSDRAAAVGHVVPVARARCVQAGTVLLHNDASHNVLEWFAQLGELVQALFHHIGRPLVDLVVLVGVAAYCSFHCFLDDVADFIHHKRSLFGCLILFHSVQLLANYGSKHAILSTV